MYATTSEAAIILDVSIPLVIQLIHKGKLKAEAVGNGKRKNWLIDADSLEALRREREINPPKRGWGASVESRKGKIPSDGWSRKKPMPSFSWAAVARFVHYTEEVGDCLLWRGPYSPSGYGYFYFRGQTYAAHRVSYFLNTGIDPGDNDVLHSCDNKLCVESDHLHLGNDQENSDEKFLRNRQKFAYGESHPMAKLTEEDVREIRNLSAQGVSQREIGERFGINQSHVSDIVTRKKWSSVP